MVTGRLRFVLGSLPSSYWVATRSRVYEMATTAAHKPRKLAPEQTRAIEDELEAILNCKLFSGTKRSSDFLEFDDTMALAGDYESLAERVIGAELFGRRIPCALPPIAG